MRISSLLVAGGAVLLAGVGLVWERPASAKDAETLKVGQAVLDFAKGTMAGGEFGMEIAADGSLGRLESQVALDGVPKPCLDAAAKHAGGGTAVRADKQWVGGDVYWQVTHDVGGLREGRARQRARGRRAGHRPRGPRRGRVAREAQARRRGAPHQRA